MKQSSFTVRLAGSAAEIGESTWDACANPAGIADPHPFCRYAFYHAVEASGSASARTGWRPVHLIIEHDGRVDGILPAYLKNHSQGEYVFDHSWADALERTGGDYYPKLQASVPFTPVTGPRLLIASHADTAQTFQALLAGGVAVVKELGASSLHITFLPEEDWRQAGALGFLQRQDQQFHWENKGYGCFDDFLGELSSAKRKNLRKERAAVRDAGIEFDWLTGADLTEAHWDRFFEFYVDTGSRKWGRPYLTREFFSRIGSALADQTLLVMARRGRRYVAGALNLFGEGILFGRNWGAIEYHPFLHFEACYYQAIDFAIARKFKKVEAGAQGAHKLLRGYMPTATYSAHYIAHPGLRRAVDEYLARERAAVSERIEQLADRGPFRKTG